MTANRPVWLVLPTYDEAENLEAIVAAAREHLPAERRVLIVDDNSPDGTGEIADRLAAEHEDVSALHRDRKQGLGPAYVAGFHEDCTVAIGKKLALLLKPKWLRIGGYWYPRGGMPIDVFWQTGTLPEGVWLPDQGVAPYRGRG